MTDNIRSVYLSIHLFDSFSRNAMTPLNEDPFVYAKDRLLVNHFSLPEGMIVHEEIGKGSNNKVFKATYGSKACVLRVPRRRSDTQQRGSAFWEFAQTLHASRCAAAPQIYKAWIARHATKKWPSGLYLVMEHFSHTLESLQDDEREQVAEHSEKIGESIAGCLEVLAKQRMFVYDLKPSNVVVRLDDDSNVTTRIIDFGRDFAEWIPDGDILTDAFCVNAPHIRFVMERLSARVDEDRDALLVHILFASMLAQLAATTTHRLYEDREEIRMERDLRKRVNCVAPLMTRLLDNMQGRNVAIVRAVLRQDDVKGVLKHYHGRRSAGTRRTMRLARGEEHA